MKTANILLVDEDQDQRTSISTILQSGGYSVVEAEHAEHAIRLLSGSPFALVLVNLTLPDTTSMALLEYLHVHHIDSKVIVLIGSTEQSLLADGASVDVRDHRFPRYEPSSLLKSVEHALAEGVPPAFGLQIVKAGEFIRSTPTGVLDMKASKRGLSQIASAGEGLKDYTVLIDLRGAISRLSTPDVYELASDLVSYGETFRRKTALLTRVDGNIDQARFFETVAVNGGLKIRAFTDFEKAMIWLSKVTDQTEPQGP